VNGFIRVAREAAQLAASFIDGGLEPNGKPGVLLGMLSRLSLAIIALSFALLVGAFVLTVFTF
jgi:hypothetical protein